VYELGGSSHWSAIRRKINDGVVQGGFRPSRTSVGGTQVEEIATAWLSRGDNVVRFEPRDNVDPTGFTVASVRIVATREAPTSAEPLLAPLEAHGAAYARWTDGEPSTAVTGVERNLTDRAGLWSWRDSARVDALNVLTRGTGSTQIELSWTTSDGRTRARRTLDVPANSRTGTSERLTISPPIDTSELRVAVLARGEHPTLAIAELDVHAAAVVEAGARLSITWPAHGECVDREAYVRGFALGSDGRAATELWVDGQPTITQGNADGSFGVLVAVDAGVSGAESHSEHQVEARFADGTTKQQRFVLGRCVASSTSNSASAQEPPREDVGAPFGGWARANADTTLTLGDVVVEIPAGAVARDTRITLRPLTGSDVPALDRGMVNTSPDGRAYRFGPDGLRFSKPIRLSLPFGRGRLSAGTTDADIKPFYYDVGGRRWREVTRVATGANDRIAAATNHFTDYITATITAPDSPQSTAFDANTIQGLQAANPAAGVQMIAPPTPNASGSANLSFPIVVPPGRQGMQPAIALSYDSSRGNGPLGVGWDVGVSRVEADASPLVAA
jgi:hypothetical protein